MYLLIPAAGMGKRMGSDRNKLLLTLHGKPLLAWTIIAAMQSSAIIWIGIMAQPEDWEAIAEIIAAINAVKPVQIIQGGETRQKSVYTSPARGG
jgi:2-C-methyl-D-erythritol 4-phosphate cytidylyltransferase